MKESDHCKTPSWLYKALDAEFGFDLDPCPLGGPKKFDGLEIDWGGRVAFVNPPYSEIKPWVEKALASAALTVLLLPARTGATWWHLLNRAGAEFRVFRRVVWFRHVSGRPAKPLGGSAVVVIRRLACHACPNSRAEGRLPA